MDQTMPAVTTKVALLRFADAFHEMWNKSRDVLAATEALEASFVEEERRLAQLREHVAVLAAEHERLAEPLATLKSIRERIKN